MSNQEEQILRKRGGKELVRLSEPRILPLDKKEKRKIIKKFMDKAEWEKLEQIIMEDIKYARPTLNSLNLWGTLMKYEDLCLRFLIIIRHVSRHSTLPERERELVIIRLAWLCFSEYEWGQHVLVSKLSGITDDEIKHIIEGPNAKEWAFFDAALLCAVDELYYDTFISNKTWNILTKRFSTKQMMDLVFTIGQYNTIAMALNTFSVQLEEGKKGFPE